MNLSRETANKHIRDYKKLQAQLAECDSEDKARERELTEPITAEPECRLSTC